MAKNLESDFDQEEDLSASFDAEPSPEAQVAQQASVSEEPSFLQKAGETAIDTARSVGQGLTYGASDEIIAGLKAAGGALTSDENWKDLFRKYQAEEQKKIQDAEHRSPTATTIGEIAGGLAPAVLTAGSTLLPSIIKTGGKLTIKEIAKAEGKKAAMKELAKRALATGAVAGAEGALYGAGASEEGKLIDATPEERKKLLEDTLSGGAVGAIAGTGLSAAGQALKGRHNSIKDYAKTIGLVGTGGAVVGATGGALLPGMDATEGGIAGGIAGTTAAAVAGPKKVAKFLEDSPFWRQMKQAFEKGKQKINVTSDEAKFERSYQLKPGEIGPQGSAPLIDVDTEASMDMVNRIYAVDQKLGQQVGKAVDEATGAGMKIDLSNEMLNSVNVFKNLLEKDSTLLANPKAQKLYDIIFQLQDTNLTPREVQSLRNQVLEFADAVKLKHPDVASLGYQFQGQIGDLLKSRIPAYKVAAERFSDFRRLVPETIISGPVPVEVSQVSLGNLKNDQAKLLNSLNNMINGATKLGSGSIDAQKTFMRFIEGLKEFEGKEALRVKQGIIKDIDVPKLVDVAPGSTQTETVKKLVRDKADESAMLQQVWGVNPQEGSASAIKGSAMGSSTGRGKLMNLANKYGLVADKVEKAGQVATAPVKIIKSIRDASEEQLRAFGQSLSDTSGTAAIGRALIKGLDNKDVSQVNAAIFAIMQNPQARMLFSAENPEPQEQTEE